MSEFTLGRRETAVGLDASVPSILFGGRQYSPDVDHFLLSLPVEGVRSPRSIRAYAYDLVLWLRFLLVVQGKSILEATSQDVADFHRARRRGPVDERVTAATWNRCVSSLMRFYQWALDRQLIEASPIATRTSRALYGRHVKSSPRVLAMEKSPRRREVRYLQIEEYQRFVADGLWRQPGAGSSNNLRNSVRNELFADFLVTTGLRLQEAAGILRNELPLECRQSHDNQIWFSVPAGVAKGGVERRVFAPHATIARIARYMEIERPIQAAHWIKKVRGGSIDISRSILVSLSRDGSHLRLQNGEKLRSQELDAAERERLVLCNAAGAPVEPAPIWLSERGGPVSHNGWERIFARASSAAFPGEQTITPHQLRHTYAVHVLALLLKRQRDGAFDGAASSMAEPLRGDPIRIVQRLLGHASIETTFIYTDVAERDLGRMDLVAEELLDLITASSSR